MTPEPRDIRIRRLAMRSKRRGIREMDLILSAYADRHLGAMSDPALDLFESLLNESDPDLLQWVTGQSQAPDHYAGLIGDISQTFQS